MEFDEDKVEETEGDYVEIYSKRAIFWFSVFSFIYGGILLTINLRAAGYKKAVLQVAAFIISYYILSVLIVVALNIKVDMSAIKMLGTGVQVPPQVLRSILILSAISIVINIIGGLVLTQYFFKRYFPDNDYYPKPVLQPILIFILIYIAFRFII
ncbi:hypothetical protein SAMN05421821_12057 [Mucilaginibacter lappiensis]|uniref:Yip1 domain-containing protein n=1 Tax=Mucilaginibacter lappiensis TaxID=354630 RepID=A0ABR6PSB1_9SPHI|nr:hypothetical protein [Mucilaginibacter lappiensis]MBB6112629.1 hypothetical protein [Mucilaginibacter lappiensis]SIS04841.1 hypothetical protein SAMN05421821_12057 [Mucilaginibacter lappiensis]